MSDQTDKASSLELIKSNEKQLDTSIPPPSSSVICKNLLAI